MELEQFISLTFKPRSAKARAKMKKFGVSVEFRQCLGKFEKRDEDVSYDGICICGAPPEILGKRHEATKSKIPSEDGKALPEFKLEPNFADLLNQFINEKGLKDRQVYEAADITKANFWNQVHNKRKPNKNTAMALCIGLELSLEEAKKLLKSAGYCFSHSNLRDVIVEYFIVRGFYKIIDINLTLVAHDEDPLTNNRDAYKENL